MIGWYHPLDLTAFLLALGLIFVAELGDKTQLLVLALASRYAPLPILGGVFVGTALVNLVSVVAGTFIGRVVPMAWIELAGGILFVIFGLVTLRGDDDDDDTDDDVRFGPFLAAAIAIFVAEIGDKTMVATMTIASQQQAFLAVWLGATLGMFGANALATAVGWQLGRKLPERPLRLTAAAVFIIAGIVMIVLAARGLM